MHSLTRPCSIPSLNPVRCGGQALQSSSGCKYQQAYLLGQGISFVDQPLVVGCNPLTQSSAAKSPDQQVIWRQHSCTQPVAPAQLQCDLPACEQLLCSHKVWADLPGRHNPHIPLQAQVCQELGKHSSVPAPCLPSVSKVGIR